MANADALLLSVSADIRQLQKQMDKAQGIVRDSSRRMVRTVDAANENISQKLGRGFGTAIGNNIRNLSGQVGNVSDAFSGFGAAGIAASAGIAAGLAAVTIAAKQAQAALELGDMIADEAEKVGIGTDALQEYQYAIAQTGGEAKDAAPAIAAFTRTLGAAQSGLSPKSLKAFTALGFTKEQLKSFDSAEDALRAVSDKVAALGSEAERAAVAEKLGLTPLLPLLRQGTVEMDRLRKAAHDLGYVLDEDLVKSLGDLKDKSDAASQVLKVQLASAFSGVAGAIVNAKLALTDFLLEYNKLVNSANGKRVLSVVGTALDVVTPGRIGPRAASMLRGQAPPKVTMAELQKAMAAKPVSKPEGTSLSLLSRVSGGGGGSSAKDKGPVFDLPASIRAYEDWLDYRAAEDKRYNDQKALDLMSGVQKAFDFSGVSNDLVIQVSEDFNQAAQDFHDNVADAVAGGLDAGIRGGLPGVLEYLTQRFQRSLVDSIANSFADAFASSGKLNFGGGGGGLLGGLVKGAFGGGNLAGIASSTIKANPFLFAEGTDYAPGGMSIVGERGPELLNIPRGGQVIPNDILRSMSKREGGSSRTFAPQLTQQIHFHGGMTSADRRQTLRQASAAAMREMAGARRQGF